MRAAWLAMRSARACGAGAVRHLLAIYGITPHCFILRSTGDAIPVTTAPVADLPDFSGTDGAVQLPASFLRHAQWHLHRTDAGDSGAGRCVGHVSDCVLLYCPGGGFGGWGIGVDRAGLGRGRDADGEENHRRHADPGFSHRLGGGDVGQSVCAPGFARLRHAGGCAGRCCGLCADHDVDHAATAGFYPANPVIAGRQRHGVAAAGAGGVHRRGAVVDARAYSGLGRFAALGHFKCCLRRAGRQRAGHALSRASPAPQKQRDGAGP